MRKIASILFLAAVLTTICAALDENTLYSNDYALTISPKYPAVIGDTLNLRLRTFYLAQKATLYSDRELEIPMVYRDGYWWGKFALPEDYKEGWHFFTVWTRRIAFRTTRFEPVWSKSMVWYRTLKKIPTAEVAAFPVSFEAEEEEVPIVTGETVAIRVSSTEALPFIIKGSKMLTFTSKSVVGTKEGFVPGQTREESLRLNISGKSDDTEVDANLISTSTAGTTQVAQREEKVSVLVRKASTEAYLGDFTADLTETEFTKLNKVLSGMYLKGDYGPWGFNALYSSPKGEAKYLKIYGDGTQGPFQLGSAPVVIDSERIYLDGAPQKRGDDYTVDYNAGTITFVRKTIDPRSILEINYDYRQTVYQHATYGLRVFSRPSSNLKLGATYLDDSDSLAGAAEIRQSMTGEAVDPQGHFVAGADGSYVSENLSANGEVAYSRKNLNLLASQQLLGSGGSEESGRAVKLDLSSQLGPMGLTLHGKRIGPEFQPIAEANPKQDVTNYGGSLSFRPGALLGMQGSYDRDKYAQSGVVYDNYYKTAKANLTPERFPSLEYNFYESDESNDPVTGDNIQRIITRNSAETLYRLGVLSASLKGTSEKWLRRSPSQQLLGSEEVTDYRRVNIGLSTIGIEKLTFTSNVELEDRVEPTGATPYRRTYNLNLSASPARSYFISTSLEYLDDSAQGVRNSTDISYRAEPSEVFKTDGKFTITTVSEDFATSETVSKQTGSFSFDLRPAKYLRLRYLFKPNFTKILRADSISYNNQQQQAEVNLIPLREVMVGLLYKLGSGFNVYKQDPNFKIKQNTSDTDSILCTLKMAPFQILSTEFNYLLENGRTTSLVTAEPLAYTPGQNFGKKFDALVRTSLSERFSIDSRYTYQRNTQGTGEAASNLADSVSHTASLKGLWNISDAWSFSLSGAYTRTTDNLSSSPLSYTLSPGFGFIFRQGERLRVDFDYTYSRSYAGLETEKTDYSLRGKYSLSDYVNVTLRGEQEVSRQPDYRLTDISGSVEINL